MNPFLLVPARQVVGNGQLEFDGPVFLQLDGEGSRLGRRPASSLIGRGDHVELVLGSHQLGIGDLSQLLVEGSLVGPVGAGKPLAEVEAVDSLGPVVAGHAANHLDGAAADAVRVEDGVGAGVNAAGGALGNLEQGPEVRQVVDLLIVVLAVDHVHDALSDPLRQVQPQRAGPLDVGGDQNRQLTILAAGLDGLMDPLDPGGHGFQAGFHFLGVKEIVVAEPQLEPVNGVILQHFLDERETLVLHFPVLEVQLPRPVKAFIEVAPGSNFQMPVVPGEIGRANVPMAVRSPPPVEQ